MLCHVQNESTGKTDCVVEYGRKVNLWVLFSFFPSYLAGARLHGWLGLVNVELYEQRAKDLQVPRVQN